MSVKKHWLLVGCYPGESCQWRNTDYRSDGTLGNHVSEETLTTGRLLPSWIMSVTKHWLLVGCYPWQSCQWRKIDYLSDVILGNHVRGLYYLLFILFYGDFFLLHSLRKFFPETCITLECRYSCFWHKRSQDHLNRLNLLFNCVYFTDLIPEGNIWPVVTVSSLTWFPRVTSDQ